MRLASAVALLLLLHHPLLTQDPRRAPSVPNGARVRIDTKSGLRNLEGTVVAWRADTVLVKSPERADTLRFARTGIQKLRILESPALWRYNSPSEINYYFTAAIPRPYDIASATGDSHEHLLLIGTKTQLVGVNPTTGAVTWARKDLADLKAVGLDIVGSTGFAIVTRGDTLHIIDLRTGVERWNTATVSFLSARGWLPRPTPTRLSSCSAARRRVLRRSSRSTSRPATSAGARTVRLALSPRCSNRAACHISLAISHPTTTATRRSCC